MLRTIGGDGALVLVLCLCGLPLLVHLDVLLTLEAGDSLALVELRAGHEAGRRYTGREEFGRGTCQSTRVARQWFLRGYRERRFQARGGDVRKSGSRPGFRQQDAGEAEAGPAGSW